MQLEFLGTGAAEGIPAINCNCHHCTKARQEGGKLLRQRSALFVSLPDYGLLVETPPDIRSMLGSYEIGRIDGIFLSHAHYDHAGGLEEFLYWQRNIDFFAENAVYTDPRLRNGHDRLRDIAFHCQCWPGVAVRFEQFFFTLFAVRHTVPCFGLALYECGHKAIYAADSGPRWSNYARCLISKAAILIVNVPRFEPPSEDHLTVVEAISLKEELDVQHLILTHINHHNRPHDELENYVSQFDGVTVAYDGLTLSL